MTIPQQSDHWSRDVRTFLKEHLEQTKHTVRIATGFFTIEGYDLLRTYLSDKLVMVMVGFDEADTERIKTYLLDNILLHLSRWNVVDRREAVYELIKQLKADRLRIVEQQPVSGVFDARVRQGDHAKIYILDDRHVIVGSANFTTGGLRRNIEGLTIVSESERVNYWLSKFEEFWNRKDTYDITADLLAALLRWLDLVPPHHIYLKTLAALNPQETTLSPRPSYKMPVAYQQVVVERMLRQLRDSRGAFLVASTGLGKTVMATHTAYRLQQAGEVTNVIVFAPKAVHLDWESALADAGLNATILTREVLDIERVKGEKSRKLQTVLNRVDERYLIIIDESQRFRHRTRSTGDRDRTAFRRLITTVREQCPRVILLTATPYAKHADDINNQLALLPHTAHPIAMTSTGQHVLPSLEDEVLETTAWHIQERDDWNESFNEFMQLPVCTVVSTSQVAKHFGTRTPEGEYLDFHGQRKWFPQIALHRVETPMLLESVLSPVFHNDCLEHKPVRRLSRGGWRVDAHSIKQEALSAWLSSPRAIIEVLKDVVMDEYSVTFKWSKDTRQAFITPIIATLTDLTYHDDHKLVALAHVLNDSRERGDKVLLFVARLATAIYLEEALLYLCPSLKVANVVTVRKHRYELKDFTTEILPLICDFAPVANADKLTDYGTGTAYDILITTDAFSAGVNLQDARVVVSYDLTWTPDVIVQRAGRILRFWREPRQVALYVFINQFKETNPYAYVVQQANRRLETLVERTRKAEQISEVPMIPQEDSAIYDSLSELATVDLEYLGKADLTEIEEFSGGSGFVTHIAELKRYEDTAGALPDDLTSVRHYTRSEHLIYLLLRHNGTYYPVVYGIKDKRKRDIKEDELLDLLQCDHNTPVALVDADIVERHAQASKRAWIKSQGIPSEDQVERICALYLLPEGDNALDTTSDV